MDLDPGTSGYGQYPYDINIKWNSELFYVKEVIVKDINGVETTRSTFGNGVSQVDETLLISLCVPGAESQAKMDKETYKTEFIVDYVKIYQK